MMLDTGYRAFRTAAYPPASAGSHPVPVARPRARSRVPVAKLAFDKVFAALALLCLGPVLAVIALSIHLRGKGPILFAHDRIGQNGRPFRCLKFRTMRPGNGEELDEILRIDPIARDEWAEQRKLERDPRVDGIGHFLRVTSLDELPQFWNVLKGDMSVVGPRPITVAEIEKYGDNYADYISVRPGLTGIWQVSGRSDTSYDRRVALDVSYVRNWSLWQDVRITVRTVGVMVHGRGAY